MLDTLFPGPESVFQAQLFTTWNNVADLSVVYGLKPEEVVRVLRAGGTLLDEGGSERKKPIRMQPRLDENAEKEALLKVAALIEKRLRLSYEVKDHLLQVRPPVL